MGILVRPIITEKASFESEEMNRYTFEVALLANKLQVKEAVESLYGVDVLNVNTMRVGGGKAKTRFTAKGVAEQRNTLLKKAIVTIAEGQSIDLYGNI